MNQPYARVNQPYATLTLASALREVFGVQLYKNNARPLLSCILSILNLDWLQHARSVRGVYEFFKNFAKVNHSKIPLMQLISLKRYPVSMKLACITDLIPKFCSLCGKQENKTISFCELCSESSIKYRPYTLVP